ncbi:MAG: RnfABCDGE type electron transport complex subunit G [Candidatus Cloacimonetes bacterium]|nr:RnfABCDGE type electron transport complex subunit G [Candidatus Cloacimonadota bacterium]
MSYFIKLGLVLLIITAIASGILAYVNDLTKDKIAENKVKAEELARIEVLPGTAKFDKQSVILPPVQAEPNPLKKQVAEGPLEFVYYSGLDTEGNLTGYTFVASQYGYSSEVKTMVGVDTAMNIIKIKVIEQAETPGLGANAATDVFRQRFEKKQISELKVDKDGGEIVSLTGATITSRAVTNSIAAGLQILTDAVGKEEER